MLYERIIGNLTVNVGAQFGTGVCKLLLENWRWYFTLTLIILWIFVVPIPTWNYTTSTVPINSMGFYVIKPPFNSDLFFSSLRCTEEWKKTYILTKWIIWWWYARCWKVGPRVKCWIINAIYSVIYFVIF